MEKCGICKNSFEERELTTVTPSQYLGKTYPDITKFCPLCFQKFLVKAQDIYRTQESTKEDALKEFTES